MAPSKYLLTAVIFMTCCATAADWVLRKLPDGSSPDFIARGKDCFVAVGANGSAIRSETGSVWTNIPKFTTNGLTGVVWDGSAFWASTTEKVYTSRTGLDWTAISFSSGFSNNALAYGNGVFLLYGTRPGSGRFSEYALITTTNWMDAKAIVISRDPFVTQLGRLRFENGLFWLPQFTFLPSDAMGGPSLDYSENGEDWWNLAFPGSDPNEDRTRAVMVPSAQIDWNQILATGLFIWEGSGLWVSWPFVYSTFPQYLNLEFSQLVDRDAPAGSQFGIPNGSTLLAYKSETRSFLLISSGYAMEIAVPYWQPGTIKVYPVIQAIPSGAWQDYVKWPVGMEANVNKESFVFLDGSQIMQNTFPTPFFAETPRINENGEAILTVNLPPGHAINLMSKTDLTGSEEQLVQHFDAGVGSIEIARVPASALNGTPTGNLFFLLRPVN